MPNISIPIFPYQIIKILDVAMLSDIMRGVEGLPSMTTSEYWLYYNTLRYLLGYEGIPANCTTEIIEAVNKSAQEWRQNVAKGIFIP